MIICVVDTTPTTANANPIFDGPFAGFILLLSSIAGVFVGIVFSRIAAEFILIVFRINEHLGAIRDQGQMNWSRLVFVLP
jgi:Domain of unknown function (DUF4282)